MTGAAQRISDASIAFYERVRSQRAGEAAAGAPTGSIDGLRRRKYANVVTYRRDGEAVPTPVWFGLDGGRLYFRSVATGAKLRRIAHTPRVRVAPCTATGRPLGPAVAGVARVLEDPAEIARAEATIASSYGVARRIYKAFIGERVEGRYVEVVLEVGGRAAGI